MGKDQETAERGRPGDEGDWGGVKAGFRCRVSGVRMKAESIGHSVMEDSVTGRWKNEHRTSNIEF